MCPPHAFGDGSDVERLYGSKIDYLDLNAFTRKQGRRVEDLGDELAGAGNGEVPSWTGRSARGRRVEMVAPSGTWPFDENSALGSSMMTGSCARSAVFINPFASAGFDGRQTISPGKCAQIGW